MKMTTTLAIRKWSICLLSLVSLLLLATASWSQSRKITGHVGATSGKSVVSATVAVKGTSNYVTTDNQGNFSILAAPNETLVITSVGFLQQEIRVGDQQTINVSLSEDYVNVEEVVVIGYGTMKKTDLSSSQVSVTSAELQRTINTNLEQALQGRAANVYVSQSSGQPGAAPSVIIRGLNSLTGNTQPLYVIDGVQIRPNNPRDDPYNHPNGFTNILSHVNPDDIETVNILQGPAATAIFGAAGASGVVMITTKRGKAGDTKVTASTLFTIQDEPEHIDVMNLREYAAYRNQVAAAGGTGSEISFSDPSVLGEGTDWQDALYRNTLLQKHSIALSGGTDRSQFYFSGEYFNQEGIAPGSGFNRYSARLNLDNQARTWLKFGVNLTASQTKEKINTSNAGIIGLALQQNPGVPVKNPDGSWGGPATTQFQFTNPVMIANIYNDRNKSSAIIGGVYVNINLPVKGLVWYNSANTSINYFNYYSFHPGYTAGGFVVPQSAATSSRSASNNLWWNFNTRFQYDTKIKEDHAITLMAGHEASSYQGEGLSGGRVNFITNINQELSGGDASTISNISNSSNKYHGAQESFFGRVNYIFKDRYILLGTFRADGSSSFGENKRWGYFPAGAVAWRVSQEEFMKNIASVNDLKLRVEYGLSGNSGGSGIYSTLQTVPTGWGPGFLSANFNNPDLQWETTKTLNFGIDLHMFKNRLEVIADIYTKNIEDLLTARTGPYTLGGDISYSPGYLQWPSANVGEMRNHGFGVTVNTVNIDNKSLMWKTGLNVSVDRNKITKLQNALTPIWGGSSAQIMTKEGNTASLILGYVAEGLFTDYNDIAGHAKQTATGAINPTQGTWVGDIKFKDLNKDGVINELDKTVIGNPWPKFTFGFNNYITYKEFDLNILFIGSQGNDILNYPRYQNEIPLNNGVFGNAYRTMRNFAIPSTVNPADAQTATLTNPGHRIPRIAPGDPNGNTRVSTWFIEDGSYVRLKNVTLGYNVPKKWINKVGIKGLRATVGAQNLFTITKYKGYDPEIGMVNYSGTLMAGIDVGRYPSVRFYSFGLVADF
jgi:TonB-dependent starch-binding outer membrane protein SusC